MRVLAGDIGGTKTAVAIAEIDDRRIRLVRQQTYPSREWPSLEEVVIDFLGGEEPPRVAGFGVAGPVVRGRARVTHLSWTVDPQRLSRQLRIPLVTVRNDFVAQAMGIPYVSARGLVTLHRGKPERGGPIAVLGAGTGLGQAALVPCGAGTTVAASEAGHVEYGPRDETEDRLVAFVRRRTGRATREQFLSGRGVRNIYDFLLGERFAPEDPATAAEIAGSRDAAPVITRRGLEGKDRLCVRTLEMFASIYGSEAANTGILYRATGGVYVSGGIAGKILPVLRGDRFLRAFLEKPPMQDLVSRIRVRVVVEPRIGTFGAAALAYRAATTRTDTRRFSALKTSSRRRRR
ncbi:MAG TPA: glucokinase [Thermoanaerobaculia bacterium]|jgi:glucokinase